MIERAITAVARFTMQPGRGDVAFGTYMLGCWILYPRWFLVNVVAFAFLLDWMHDRRMKDAWRAGKTISKRRARYKRSGKRAPTLRAVKAQSGVTVAQRQDAWCVTTSERIGIDPPFRRVRVDVDEARNEMWDVRVPIGPGMNPSILAKPGYAAGIRGCVKGKCYGVNVSASSEDPGIAHIFIVRTDIRAVEAGPAPIIKTAPRSISEPVQIGINALRAPRLLSLVDRNGIGIFGMPGSGKSTLLHTIIAHSVAALDANVRLGDLKDGIDGEAWERSTIYTESVSDVRKWIKEFCADKDGAFTSAPLAVERARALKKLNVRKWKPGVTFVNGDPMPLELIIIDEIDNLTPADQAALAWITLKLRAVGVRPIIATQLPRADTLYAGLSNALNVRIGFAVDNVIAANIALGSGAVGRGYDCSTLPMPGFCYVKDAQERDASIVRTHMLETDDVVKIARRFPYLAPMQSGPASESDANRTPEGGSMEAPTDPERPVSDPILTLSTPPPDDTAGNPKMLALWNAMPGTRAQLCDRSGYSPSQASAILSEWHSQGRAWTIKRVWHQRQPVEQRRHVA